MGARPPEGLAGLDLLRRFVTDVDGPAEVVRLHPPAAFTPAPGAKRIGVLRTHRAVIAPGSVPRVGAGELIVDTGAPVEAVLTSLAMLAAFPRLPGSGANLAQRDDMRSPDYWTEVPSISIGPFAFPATPVVGRDRERERVGASLGLVGMGLLRHLRVAFDLEHASLWAAPGPSYHALVAAGLEVEDGPRGNVVVTRVVRGGNAEAAGIRRHDEVLAVDGRLARGADAVRRALGQHTPLRRLRIARGDQLVTATVAVMR